MAKRGKAVSTVVTEDKDWKRPAHSGFEGPAYGEVVPGGPFYEITKDGPKRIKTK